MHTWNFPLVEIVHIWGFLFLSFFWAALTWWFEHVVYCWLLNPRLTLDLRPQCFWPSCLTWPHLTDMDVQMMTVRLQLLTPCVLLPLGYQAFLLRAGKQRHFFTFKHWWDQQEPGQYKISPSFSVATTRLAFGSSSRLFNPEYVFSFWPCGYFGLCQQPRRASWPCFPICIITDLVCHWN